MSLGHRCLRDLGVTDGFAITWRSFVPWARVPQVEGINLTPWQKAGVRALLICAKYLRLTYKLMPSALVCWGMSCQETPPMRQLTTSSETGQMTRGGKPREVQVDAHGQSRIAAAEPPAVRSVTRVEPMLNAVATPDHTGQGRRIVFLSTYPLDRIDKGPKVRISNLLRALSQLCAVDLIAGLNSERRPLVHQYLQDGRFRGAFGLYVESSTGWCTPHDLRLMAACRRAGIPVFTWIRDAYPMFPETMTRIPVHKRFGASLLWRLSVWGYFRTSDAIGSQSESFSRLFDYPSHVRRIVLKQGARELDVPPISARAAALLYTGNASESRFGVDLLVKATERARETLPKLRLLLVCPPTGLPPKELLADHPWIELLSLQTDEIPGLLPQVRVLVNPLRDAPYHRLQIPTKIMDYLGYGRPILSTDLPEIAAVIRDTGAGIVVPDSVEGLAEGILRLFSAGLDEVNAMGQSALRAVREKHSWRHRAQQIMDTFAELRHIGPTGGS